MKRILLTTAAIVSLTSVGHAADLYSAPAVEEPGVVYAGHSFNWTGVYVGVQAGYGWANLDADLEADVLGPVSDSFDFDADGWLAGVNVGADLQIGSFVVGILADYNWAGIEGDINETGLFGAPIDIVGEVSIDNIWNVLARAGFLVNPQTLLYVLGGYSQADAELSYLDPSPEGGSDTLEGWTFGFGGEWMMTRNVSFKTEYRYTAWDDSNFTFTDPDGSASIGTDQHSVLAGINLRWGVAP